MNKFLALAAIGLAIVWPLPTSAMPSDFDQLDNATFCSIKKGHSLITLDNEGKLDAYENKNVRITLSKFNDVWKVRIDWWPDAKNYRHVEYALAGWINPKTLAYIEASSSSNMIKVIGEGHLRFIDDDTINYLQYGILENGSAAMLSENLTRVETMPIIDLPFEVIK